MSTAELQELRAHVAAQLKELQRTNVRVDILETQMQLMGNRQSRLELLYTEQGASIENKQDLLLDRLNFLIGVCNDLLPKGVL
jgi:hypothetical protein